MANDELSDEERRWTDAIRAPSPPPKTPRLYEHLIRERIAESEPPPAVCVTPITSVREAMNLMQQHRIGCVLVQEADRLVGIFTERDVLLRVVGGNRDPAELSVREVMTPDPEAVGLHDELAWVLNLMAVGGFRHVPIVDEQHRPIAVVSVKDVVERLVELFPKEVLNLPPRPGKNIVDAREGA